MSTPKLSELVASRISHDVLGPLGAVMNGVELMELSGHGSQELALVAGSALSVATRLRLYRCAFGPGGEDRLSEAELVDISQGLGTAHMRFFWHDPKAMTRRDAKAALLFCLCAERILPLQTNIEIRQETTYDFLLRTRVPAVGDYDAKALEKTFGDQSLMPTHIEFHLLPDALLAAGKKLVFEGETGQLTIAMRPI